MWRKIRDRGTRLRKSTSLKELRVFTVTRIWEWSVKNVIGDYT